MEKKLQEILLSLANDEVFSPGKCLNIKLMQNDNDKGMHNASQITFAVITMDNLNVINDIPVVVKQQPPDHEINSIFKFNKSFALEVYMYKTVLPMLHAERISLFPKCYYGNATLGADYNRDLLITEDLNKDNFTISKQVFLDYDHIVIALKKMAQFHALSYTAKRINTANFFKIVLNLEESKFYNEDTVINHFYSYVNIKSINLLINSVAQQESNNHVLYKVGEKLKNIKQFVKYLLKPSEPFAVVCHGDFCFNNIIFKHNETNTPSDIKVFDLQNSTYSNPAIDLSFFLYLNTSPQLRDNHWQEFLSIYWESLNENTKELRFTYKQFLENFATHAIYGMIPTSFFLPMTLEKCKPLTSEYYHLPKNAREELLLKFGNEESWNAVLEITKHMYKNNYFHRFVEYCETLAA